MRSISVCPSEATQPLREHRGHGHVYLERQTQCNLSPSVGQAGPAAAWASRKGYPGPGTGCHAARRLSNALSSGTLLDKGSEVGWQDDPTSRNGSKTPGEGTVEGQMVIQCLHLQTTSPCTSQSRLTCPHVCVFSHV